ncbi:MAG: hypothetical protein PHO79_04785 [Desulfoplanes sp.]|nr:hypothetical protein [Desulfoplanes sp.]MDD4649316.1 hypothetical protein [Desulfoplanes sp.]
MIRRVCCFLCVLCMMASLSYAGNIYKVTGIIQKIESHVITIDGVKYYPVAEDIDLDTFKAGDSVTMRYGQNKKGTRYYSQVVRAGEKLSPVKVLPPA